MSAHKRTAIKKAHVDVYKLARARAKYNREAKYRARYRQYQLALYAQDKCECWYKWGFHRQAARHFGVHHTTIMRDVKAILERAERHDFCPVCKPYLVLSEE